MTLEVILPQSSDRNSDTLILASDPEAVQCEEVSLAFFLLLLYLSVTHVDFCTVVKSGSYFVVPVNIWFSQPLLLKHPSVLFLSCVLGTVDTQLTVSVWIHF